MKEDTLQDMMQCMSDRVALVHQMPFTCDREGFSAILEKVVYICVMDFSLFQTHNNSWLIVILISELVYHLQIYFGTVQSRIYLAADFVNINCHTGMSALMRKSVLDEVGGLKTFGCYLAEDFFIAKSFTDRGWKICISSQPAMQNSGMCDVTSFQARLTRYKFLIIII